MIPEFSERWCVAVCTGILLASIGLPARARAGSCDDDRVEKVVELVNKERSSRGLGEVECDEKLVQVAEAHSRDQCEHDRMSHTGSDGSRFPERYREAGIEYRTGAENVSRGPPSAEAVHRQWMNSDGHRRNILKKGLARIGVGFVECENGRFWTQTFAGGYGDDDSRETADDESGGEQVEGDRRRSGSEQMTEEARGSDGSEAGDQFGGDERGTDDEQVPDDEPAADERGDDEERTGAQEDDEDEQFSEGERGRDAEDDDEQDGEEPFDGERPFEEKDPFERDDPFEEEPFDDQ